MSTLRTASAKKPAVLAKTLFSLERRGLYRDALAEVDHLWPDFGKSPQIDGFDPRDAAEILLRCGSLIGFHGHIEQVENSQSISKNLITDALQRFSALSDIEKVAECENQLAVVYSRTGEYNEADAYLAASLAHDIPPFSDTRLHTHAITSLINCFCKRYKENLEYVNLYRSDLRFQGSDYIKGILTSNISLSFRHLGNISEAVTYQELSKYHYQRARHKIYVAASENNLANLYRETGRFAKAHEASDHAIRLFRQLKDRTREGISIDTKANIYFAESKFQDALTTVDRALVILRSGEDAGFCVDTLVTKAKVILYLDNFSEAVLCLSEAVGIARVQSGDQAAMRLIQEFEAALNEKQSRTKKNLETDDYELVLPKSISRFKDYRGIWINSSRLETIGLVKGSLAVVVKAKVNRGDLIAVAEVENGEVSCGFYDADFGIVCLEGAEGEPQIFDEKEIRILGKIVGVCNTGRNDEGKMIVESLKI